jgi:RNA polymerase sigma factor (sigma-70 family)
MTELLSGVDAPSDAELISRVRGGDTAAYGDLFSRHVEAARRLGRQLVRGPDVDDLVSEAFAKVLQVLQGGGGPDVAFRAYLLTSVRRLHVDRVRAAAKVQPSDDMTKYDAGIPFQDTVVAGFESGAAAKAFASLPERWQLVLWHLEVEGQKPGDIAPLLGMSANSVSALAYRAREGLRQAFLTMHLADTPTEQCRWVNGHLGAYVRQGLSKRDTGKVEEHLEECRRCTAVYLELTEVNSNLSGIIAPLLLGAAAAGYLSSAGGAAGAGGLLALAGRVRDAVVGNAGAATAGAVAAGVAAVATTAFIMSGPNDREVVVGADQPITVTTQAERAPADADRKAGPDGNDGPPSSISGGVEESPQGALAAAVPTESPTDSSTASPTESPAPSDLVTPTDQPINGPGPVTTPPGGGTSEGPTASPTTEPSPTESTSPTSTGSPTVTETPNPTPTSPTPTQTDSPTVTDSASPSPSNSGSPTNTPTVDPTESPSSTTSPSPTDTTSPTESPTDPLLTADLTVTDLAVEENDLLVSVAGIPEGSVTVGVTLSSGETTLDLGGTDCLVLRERYAECIAPAMLPTGMAEDSGTTSRTFRLPLAFPDEMESDHLNATVSLFLEGNLYTELEPSDNTWPEDILFRPARPMGFDTVSLVDPQGANVNVTVTLRDIPAQIETLFFTLRADRTSFVSGDNCGYGADEDHQMVCSVMPDNGRATVEFRLRQPPGKQGELVTLEVSSVGFEAVPEDSVRVDVDAEQATAADDLTETVEDGSDVAANAGGGNAR